MVTGRDRKVAVKTKEGKQLVTMAEYSVADEKQMIGSKEVFEKGLFKGFLGSDGCMMIGDRSGTHDDIFERNKGNLGKKVVGIFAGHGDMLTLEVVGEPVAVWGPGIASRLMRLGMDEKTMMRVEGTLGSCGVISCEKSLRELSEGIDITKIKAFAPGGWGR